MTRPRRPHRSLPAAGPGLGGVLRRRARSRSLRDPEPKEPTRRSEGDRRRRRCGRGRPTGEPLAVIATNGALGNGHAANGHSKPANGSSGGSTAPITLNLGATKVSFQTQADAPSCMDCGSIMVRNGSCYKCLNCGSTSGCS